MHNYQGSIAKALCVLLMLITPISWAYETVKLSEAGDQLKMGKYIALIEDSLSTHTIAQISSGDLDYQWIHNDTPTPNFGYTDSTFWYRVIIENDTAEHQHRLVHLAYPLLDNIDFYVADHKNVIEKHIITGDTHPISAREFNHRNFLFEINFPPKSIKTIYLKVKTEGAQQLPLELWKERSFFLKDQSVLIIKAIYFGMMGVMICFNLFVYFSLRERSYIYYIGFIASFLLLQSCMTGFAQQYFWPNTPTLNHYSVLLFVPTTMLFAALFSIEFLDLKNRLPIFHKFMVFMVVLNTTNCILALFLPYAISTKISVAFVVPESLALMVVGPLLWLRGVKDARFYSLAWFTLVLGTTMAALNKFGLIPRNIITENGLVIGSALEALLLSLALADRFNREREQRFIAQNELLLEEKERQRIEEKMLHQSMHSPVTDLPNRVLFSCSIDDLIERHDPDEYSFAVVLIHLKRFHEINKTLGHQNADELLKIIAEKINQYAMELTQVIAIDSKNNHKSYAANIEGVTFAILLRSLNRDSVQMSFETLNRQMLEPVEYKGMSLDVGATLGVAFYPEHGNSSNSLLRHAHIAVDMAENNENLIAIYSKEMNPYSARRLTLMGELRKAIEDSSLELYYQPQVCLATNSVYGVEALLRWNHPNLGFIPPDEFIPLAEQTGIIKNLTKWVVNQALAYIASLRNDNIELCVSVNISALNLQERGFDLSIQELLQRYQLPADNLLLEVTETSVMQDTVRCFNMLKKLDQLGVKLSVDDFGTGHSSLAYIKRLPVQEIKIDRSFVMEMDTNPDDEIIVKTTINMCHSLKYKVVAEGVESREICGALKAMGCDYIQGYYISKPISGTELKEWLQNRTWEPLLDKIAV